MLAALSVPPHTEAVANGGANTLTEPCADKSTNERAYTRAFFFAYNHSCADSQYICSD